MDHVEKTLVCQNLKQMLKAPFIERKAEGHAAEKSYWDGELPLGMTYKSGVLIYSTPVNDWIETPWKGGYGSR